jgi:hypothetical protein
VLDLNVIATSHLSLLTKQQRLKYWKIILSSNLVIDHVLMKIALFKELQDNKLLIALLIVAALLKLQIKSKPTLI